MLFNRGVDKCADELKAKNDHFLASEAMQTNCSLITLLKSKRNEARVVHIIVRPTSISITAIESDKRFSGFTSKISP